MPGTEGISALEDGTDHKKANSLVRRATRRRSEVLDGAALRARPVQARRRERLCGIAQPVPCLGQRIDLGRARSGQGLGEFRGLVVDQRPGAALLSESRDHAADGADRPRTGRRKPYPLAQLCDSSGPRAADAWGSGAADGWGFGTTGD